MGGNVWMENFGVTICDSGIGIAWVQVSRLPMPHPDKDKWKYTTFTNNFYVFSMLLQKDHVGMYKVSNANLQHTIIIIVINKWKRIGNLRAYAQLINIRIRILSKCSSKPEFKCQ